MPKQPRKKSADGEKTSTFSEELEKKALAHVTGKLTEGFTLTSTLRAKWLELYRASRIFMVRRDSPWQSRVFIPKIFETLATIVPSMVMNLPKISLLPTSSKAIQWAQGMSQYLTWQVDQMDMETQLELWGLGSSIYGTYPAKLTWEIKTKKTKSSRTLRKNSDGSHVVEDTEREEIMKDCPKFELIDPFDFIIDPRALSVDDASYVIHISNCSLDDLKKNDDIYFNLDKLEAALTYTSKDTYTTRDNYKQNKYSFQGIPTNVGGGNRSAYTQQSKSIELWEAQCIFKPSPDEEEDLYIITVANGSTVIRYQRLRDVYNHGEKTYIVNHDQPWPGEFYGVGTVEPLLGLQAELNYLVNQRLDNLNLILNRMWLYDTSKNVEADSLVSFPGNAIPVNGDPNSAVVPVQMPNLPQDAYQEIEWIDQQIQTISGATDAAKGVTSPGFNRTAAGATIVSEAAHTRIDVKNKHLKKSYKKVLKMMLSLNPQFITKKQIVRVLGTMGEAMFQELPVESFEPNYDVSLQGVMIATSPQQRQQESQAMVTLATNPVFAEGWPVTKPDGTQMLQKFKIGKLAEDVISAFKEIDNFGQYLEEVPMPEPTPEQVPLKESFGVAAKFEMLTPEVQAQYLQKLGIQIDPQILAQFQNESPVMPHKKEELKMVNKHQSDEAKAESQHQRDMESKTTDMEHETNLELQRAQQAEKEGMNERLHQVIMSGVQSDNDSKSSELAHERSKEMTTLKHKLTPKNAKAKSKR